MVKRDTHRVSNCASLLSYAALAPRRRRVRAIGAEARKSQQVLVVVIIIVVIITMLVISVTFVILVILVILLLLLLLLIIMMIIIRASSNNGQVAEADRKVARCAMSMECRRVRSLPVKQHKLIT